MKCFFSDSLEWLYPDTLENLSGSEKHTLDVARGAIGSVNVVIAASEETTLSFASDCRDLSFYKLHAVHVEHNTGKVGFCEREVTENEYVTRRAPFDVFDAMENFDGETKINSNAAFCIQYEVPKNAVPGKVEIEIAVATPNEKKILKLTVNIHKGVIPEVGKKSWNYINWFNFTNMATHHNLKAWSPAHWRMIEKYVRLFVRARQNTGWIRLVDIAEYKDGHFVFNSSRFRRLVKLYTDCGIHYITGPHFAKRMNGVWETPTFCVHLSNHDVASQEGHDDIYEIASFLNREIKYGKLENRYIQNLADEPTALNATSYRILAGIVRKYMTGIKIMDATMAVNDLAGAVDIWCPQVQHYEYEMPDFAKVKNKGDTIWTYTCCFPGGKYMNRLLDGELARPYLIPWMCAYYGLQGFLHWGGNFCMNNEPLQNTTPCNQGGPNRLPPGDSHVSYPAGRDVWSSMRLEIMREGLEDRELLEKLIAKNSAKGKKLIKSVAESFCEYTTDIRKLRNAKKTLLKEIDALEK